MIELIDELVAGTATSGGSGGSAPVIDELNVTPSTSAQTITAPEGTDGYSPVNVSAVTSSIDANIQAGNIKSGVSILGTTGTLDAAQAITATNNSSSAVTSGDKVWINKEGTDYKLVNFLAQNTPNVTKMGSVTFTDDYIGSGFSSSNYLKPNRTISEIGTANSWEFVTKIYMTLTQSSGNGMIINQNTGNYGESGFMIFVSGSNRFSFQFFDQSLNPIAYIDSTISLQNNQWYWFKCEFTGTAYNGYISTDKETWTTIGTATSTTKVHTPTNPWRFGSSVVNSSFYLYGKIDFKETYLKINDEVAWNAIGYGMSGNITQDTFTGVASENIAIGSSGDVKTVLE